MILATARRKFSHTNIQANISFTGIQVKKLSNSVRVRAVTGGGRFLRFASFMGFCAREVPQPCKTTIVDPDGSIIAVLQVEGRFVVVFLRILGQNIKKRVFSLKIDEKTVPQLP